MPPKRKLARKEHWREDGRLASFEDDWPFKGSKKAKKGKGPTPMNMAAAGFYYTGPEDNVTCHMCNKDLDGWDKTDDPRKEHANHAPNCDFMNLELEKSRFNSYQFWPHKRGFTYKPKEFARAGFVHCASEDSADMTRCVACEKHLDGWEKDDNPLSACFHKPNCSFVAALMVSEEKTEEAEVVAESIADAPPTASRARGGRKTRGSVAMGRISPEPVAEVVEEEAAEVPATAAPATGKKGESSKKPTAAAAKKAKAAAAKAAKAAAASSDSEATATEAQSDGGAEEQDEEEGEGFSAGESTAEVEEEEMMGAVDQRRDVATTPEMDEEEEDDEQTPVAQPIRSKIGSTTVAKARMQQASPEPDATVEQYVHNLQRSETQALVFSCEEKIRAFRYEAAAVRAVITSLGDATNRSDGVVA